MLHGGGNGTLSRVAGQGLQPMCENPSLTWAARRMAVGELGCEFRASRRFALQGVTEMHDGKNLIYRRGDDSGLAAADSHLRRLQ